jgi:hypothetical protein
MKDQLMRLSGAYAIALLSLAGPALAAQPPSLPKRVGTCVFSTVRNVSARLEDGSGRPVPESGTSISLANGLYGVSYSRVAAAQNARRGDRVLACLVSIPRHCPPGDDRGRIYTTTNLRTLESWTLPDSQHMCGGA